MNNSAYYVTYKQHGQPKRAVISEQQYTILKEENGIEELTLHLNEGNMEESYQKIIGNNDFKAKKILHS